MKSNIVNIGKVYYTIIIGRIPKHPGVYRGYMIGNRKIVALCTARLHDSQNYDFIATLNKLLAGHDFSIFAYNICSDFYWHDDQITSDANVYELIDYELTDIIVIYDEQIKSRTVAERIIKKAKDYNKPVIVVDGIYEDAYSLRFDYDSGFEEMVRHVVEFHKIRDIVFLGGVPGNPFSDAREEIFKKVLNENQIPIEKDMISYGYFWDGGAQDATQNIILSGHIPEAIICVNDVTAINVELVIQKFDVDLANKIIVTGFDGLDEVYFSTPQISTVKCNKTTMAEQCALMVKKILSNIPVEKDTLVKLELFLAGSCGCHKDYISPPYYFTKLSNRFFNFPDQTRGIFRVIEKMQNTESLVDASNVLDRDTIHSLTVAINQTYIDKPKKSRAKKNSPAFDNDMLLFYESDAPKPFTPRTFKLKEIIPNIEKHLKNGFPLIFNELNYAGSTFGYACFHFGSLNILNYAQLPIWTTALKSSIGGFTNLLHQRRLMEQLDDSYKYDNLTGIYNRQEFSKQFKILHDKLKKTGGKLTVLLSDLDKLKQINDQFGHSAGDNAIKQAAAALKKSCPPRALCVRFGGDEMLAVIEGDVDTDDIKKKIDQYLKSYNQKKNLPYKIRSSVGVFKTYGSADIDFENLVKQADKSLYEEKKIHHGEM